MVVKIKLAKDKQFSIDAMHGFINSEKLYKFYTSSISDTNPHLKDNTSDMMGILDSMKLYLPSILNRRSQDKANSQMEVVGMLEEIKDLCTSNEWDDVKQFVTKDIELLNFLKKAFLEVRKYFSDIYEIDVRIADDFENVDNRILLITIYTKMDMDTALDRLDEFDKHYTIPSYHLLKGRVLFDVEAECG